MTILRKLHGAIPTIQQSKPLTDILTRHHATMKCQFDALADYVAEADKRGTKNYPLYAWTKATIENPEKKAKYLKTFTVYVDGNEVYAKPLADAIEADLQPCHRLKARRAARFAVE